MGGADKGLQAVGDKLMVQWVLERLAPQVNGIIISANRNLERYRSLGCPVVPDHGEAFAGPLAGLQAALTAATTPLIVTVPCDSPFLPLDLASRLLRGLLENRADLAVATTADKTQRAFSLLRRGLLPQLTAFLETGGRKVGDWHRTLNLCEVGFDDQIEAFRNINTLEELAAESMRQE